MVVELVVVGFEDGRAAIPAFSAPTDRAYLSLVPAAYAACSSASVRHLIKD
jgi:hypothetical protein